MISRERRFVLWVTLGYFLLLELMLVAAIWFWPNFRDNVPALRMLAPLPMMKEMLDSVESLGVGPYVFIQHTFKGCVVFGTIAAVLFAVGAVAGEVHRGTFELWLARPVSRRRLLLERYLAGALGSVIPIFLTSATVPWLLEHVDETMDQKVLFLSSVHASLVLLTFYSVTFFCSTIGRAPVKIGMLVLFALGFEFAIYVVKTATQYSVYRLAHIDHLIAIQETGSLDWSLCGWMAAFSLLCLIASDVAFARRVP